MSEPYYPKPGNPVNGSIWAAIVQSILLVQDGVDQVNAASINPTLKAIYNGVTTLAKYVENGIPRIRYLPAEYMLRNEPLVGVVEGDLRWVGILGLYQLQYTILGEDSYPFIILSNQTDGAYHGTNHATWVHVAAGLVESAFGGTGLGLATKAKATGYVNTPVRGRLLHAESIPFNNPAWTSHAETPNVPVSNFSIPVSSGSPVLIDISFDGTVLNATSTLGGPASVLFTFGGLAGATALASVTMSRLPEPSSNSVHMRALLKYATNLTLTNVFLKVTVTGPTPETQPEVSGTVILRVFDGALEY